MSNSVAKQLAIVLFMAGIVLIVAPERVMAQRRYGKSPPRYRPIQYEQEIPNVDLPTPAIEADAFPAMDDVVPPSLDNSVLPEFNEEIPYEMPSMEGFETPLAEEEYVPDDESYAEDYGGGYSEDFDQPYSSDPAPLFSTGTWFRRGSWYTQMDVLAMTRSDTRNGDLGAGNLNFILNDGGINYLFNDLVGHNFTPGTRLTLGQFLGRDAGGRDHTWEVSFLGLFDWKDSRLIESRTGGSVNTSITGQVDVFIAPFVGSDAQEIVYDADLNSLELNYMIRTRPGRDYMAMQPNGEWVRHGVGSQLRSVMAGLRLMSFNELVNYSARRSGFLTETDRITGDTGTTITNDTQTNETDQFITGNYRINTDNDMFGVQVGGELEEKLDSWTIGVTGKIGGLFNFADRRSQLSSVLRVRTFTGDSQQPTLDGDGNFVFRDPVTGDIAVDDPATPEDESQQGVQVFDTVQTFSQVPSTNNNGEKLDDENLVFLAELGGFTTYQLRPNLYFRAGYNVWFLSGVALAPENMMLDSGFGAFNVTGTVLLHGGLVGFEGTW